MMTNSDIGKKGKEKVQKLFHDLFMYRLLTGRKSVCIAVSIGLIVIFSKAFSNLAENQVARKIINNGTMRAAPGLQ